MQEQSWKPVTIEPFSSRYSISNHGRVMNVQTGKILKPCKNNMGYFIVNLYMNGQSKKRHFLVSRLVALAFIQNPQNKPFIDHIDTNPENNYFQNLRWCTQSQNLANPISRKRLNQALKKAKNTPQGRQRNRQAQLKCQGTLQARLRNRKAHLTQAKKYRCIQTGTIYQAGHEAQRQLGLSRGYVGKSARNRQKRLIEGKSLSDKQSLHFQFVFQQN